jgi:3-methyladenine DNA glycosylase AlkD
MRLVRRFEAEIRSASQELAALADPAKATGMAAYMYSKRYGDMYGTKTGTPFYGVQKPARTPIARKLAAAVDPASCQEYERLVLDLWELGHREEKYLALDVAERFRRFRTEESLDLYERLIVEGAWWDLVDTVVSRLVNPVLLGSASAWPRIDGWIDADDVWLRRSAIISQLRSKDRTDRDRLARYCVARMHESEFFIRKAIGWALREYARADPAWVRSFADEHRADMSGLSFREATKHL